MKSPEAQSESISGPAAALRRAVKMVQSQQAFAGILGVTQPAVSKWITKGELPAEHVLKVELETGVSRHELRPDLYPIEPVERLEGIRA